LSAALGAGDVACLQLRLKPAADDAVRRAAEVLMPICHAHDVALVVNDRADLAAEVEADGVHIGQEDGDYASAREAVGEEAIIGVTCHDSRHLAIEAAEAGADYVAFGAFFPTATKQTKTKTDVEIVEWWSGIMELPCVAIGGITVANCAPLVAAGADFLAVVAGVWAHGGGPAAAVRAFNAEIDRVEGGSD
jgi:thiamine-phosphate pyrophosphorylase